MEIITQNNLSVGLIEKETLIQGVRQILDLLASAQYNHQCSGMIVYKESLGDSFFDLKTGYAGELLQKFSNYKMKVAIIGDFSEYKSKSLVDFIYECNNGNCIFFKESVAEGLAVLTASSRNST
jgi:hypothetical protein